MKNLCNILKTQTCSGVQLCRKFSTTTSLMKFKKAKIYRPVKYRTDKNPRQEPWSSQRQETEVLFNTARGKIPFNRNLPITGKNTGPGVEGGSVIAQHLAAVHRVHPTGYVTKYGQFKKVKKMVPEFVVPDLSDFHLKPYVPYAGVTLIQQPKHTARDIFDEHFAAKVKEEFYATKHTETISKTNKKSSVD